MSYIKLDRKMLEWGWFKDPETTHLWVYILLNANFKESVWKGETFEVGSFPASIEKISNETGLSIQTVRTGLKRLEKTQEITRISTSLGTKIIVNKWAEYQGGDDETNIPSNKPLTNDQQTTNKQLTTLKESKNVRRKEEYILYGEYKNVKLTSEQMEKLQAEFPDDYLERIEKVSEYCASHGTKYKDYLATIRSWARKEKPKPIVEEPRKASYEEMANAWKNY